MQGETLKEEIKL